MPKTYEPIATTTLGSAASSVTFSSIPSTYTDLVVIAKAGATGGANNLYIWFNGSRGTAYSGTTLTGDGSSATSQRTTSAGEILLNYYGYLSNDLNSAHIVNVHNYANTSVNKTILARANNAGNGVAAAAGLWRSTAAITSIELGAGGSTLIAGSMFTLYGIKAA